jgi:hypothetical protein
VWYLTLNMFLTLLFANADINSRVASTCPIYFWAVADLLTSGKRPSKLGIFALVHNTGYMILNFVLFSMEVGFL